MIAASAAPRIVATVGPSSKERLADLANAGAASFRLNASHMDLAALRSGVESIVATRADASIVVDLQGAKMRLGVFPERPVGRGDRLLFALEPQGEGEVPLPHPELFDQLQRGDTLSLDDGRIRLGVLRVESRRVEAEVRDSSLLRPRKGVNVLEHPVRLEDLGPNDLAAIVALAGIPNVSWALSFLSDGHELDWLRRRCGGASVIAKIERQEALDAVRGIAEAADEVWVCRGDLGAQLGHGPMARAVARLDPRQLGRPVLMAGQVLEHLTSHADPTRSEVCHLYDLVTRGYAGIVLSDETAVGQDPVRAVAVATELLRSFAGLPSEEPRPR